MKVNVRLLLSDEESKFVATDQPELNDSEDDSEQAIASRADAIDFDRIERSLLELSWFPPALIHGFFHLQKHFDITGSVGSLNPPADIYRINTYRRRVKFVERVMHRDIF